MSLADRSQIPSQLKAVFEQQEIQTEGHLSRAGGHLRMELESERVRGRLRPAVVWRQFGAPSEGRGSGGRNAKTRVGRV